MSTESVLKWINSHGLLFHRIGIACMVINIIIGCFTEFRWWHLTFAFALGMEISINACSHK